ncbi:hypothetical protein LTR78_005025 [Recurvomyces mirabilis]|uniref:Uncharacterized protein n=1 Tax=Recurvomyces mirabilis TaxID=574656 RepID=A0AAE1C206_9PEZI|nr:hypothetical protein LTR78_005025 [Recurvomyces mirabilis]KAK5158359.1 hypothetical protein LTS14_003377 [Recurvomyces mirabilis]
MGGGDDPPPYEPYDEGLTAKGAITEDENLADQIRALRMSDVSKVLASPVLDFLLLTIFQSSNSSRLSSSQTRAADHTDIRERCIDTGSRSLKAQLSLYDLLSIHSSSGSINVGIRTYPADKEHPVPAKLVISSHAGSVKVSLPASSAPVRDYSISIESHSGSISGDLVHGRTTSVHSRSGHVNLQFVLSGASKDSSTLSTTTESGRSDVTVLAPTPDTVTDAPSSIKQLSSTHTTKDGSLSVQYPMEWEGTIEGHTESGNIRLHGRDIELIQKRPHYVLAKKGTGNSTLTFRTASGSASVCFE